MSRTLAETTAELAEISHKLGVRPNDSTTVKTKLENFEREGTLTEHDVIVLKAGLGALGAIMACHYGATGKSEIKERGER